MKSLFFLASFILMTISVFGQINLPDSTVQVIGYWDKNEKQSYTVTTEKFKVKDADTTSREAIKYDIDVTILDSAAKSYTMEWFYKNYQVKSDNEFSRKAAALANDMKVIIKTNELGVFSEVVNWKEIRDETRKTMKTLRKDFKHVPAMDRIMDRLEASFSSKEAIEGMMVADIQQFLTFHGAKYQLGEVLEGKIKVPNILGAKDFDSAFNVYLDEINAEDNNYIMRASQAVDEEQLIQATLNYLASMSDKKGAGPKREDLKELKHETLTSSRIHNSGWVIYSIQTKTVTSENNSQIEERIIEIN